MSVVAVSLIERLNAFVMVGDAMLFTVRVAVLLGEPGEGVCVVVTPDVVLGFPPTVLLVTLKVTVQLPLAGIVIPVKLSAVALALRVLGVVPAQVRPTAPPTALMLTSESVNAPPVRLEPLLFDNVRVARELPPDRMLVGLNALVMLGGATTVRLAVLLVAPVPPLVELTAPFVFDTFPPFVPVTSTTTLQQFPAVSML